VIGKLVRSGIKNLKQKLKAWNEHVDKAERPFKSRDTKLCSSSWCRLYKNSDPSDIAVTAAGGLGW
jgi:3D-(3,5/4)-trihydroxycyclohexane-1,2-dione acylhydrolase (decyclizing)